MIYTSLDRLTTHGRKTGLAALVVLTTTTAQSQTSMYWDQYSLYNPAMTALRNDHEGWLSAGVGNGNIGIYGLSTGYNLKSNALSGGVGVNYSRYLDGKNGGLDQLNFNYSQHIKLGENAQLGIGGSIGLIHENDSYSKGTALTMSLGAAYRYKNLTAGISVQNINQPRPFNEYMYHKSFRRNYGAFIDYNWKVNDRLALNTSLLISSGGIPAGPDVIGVMATVRATIDDRWWIAVSPSFEGAGLSAGYRFKNGLGIGYSYSFMYYQLIKHGGHGLTMSFRIPDYHNKQKQVPGL
jgi:hypothetical protein